MMPNASILAIATHYSRMGWSVSSTTVGWKMPPSIDGAIPDVYAEIILGGEPRTRAVLVDTLATRDSNRQRYLQLKTACLQRERFEFEHYLVGHTGRHELVERTARRSEDDS